MIVYLAKINKFFNDIFSFLRLDLITSTVYIYFFLTLYLFCSNLLITFIDYAESKLVFFISHWFKESDTVVTVVICTWRIISFARVLAAVHPRTTQNLFLNKA